MYRKYCTGIPGIQKIGPNTLLCHQLMLGPLRRTVRSPRAILDMSRPIVAVIGTTGVGKSQLAVSLAQSMAESDASKVDRSSLILSADSMQLYRGLDVITNKVTAEEMGGIEHWGLDMVTPGQGGSWEVGRWCSEADIVVCREHQLWVNSADYKLSRLPADGLPIICGGTHYFIQHFLFPPGEMSLTRAPSESGPIGGTIDLLASRWKPPCPRPSTPGLDSEMTELLETFWTPEPIWPVRPKLPIQSRQPIAGPSRPRPTVEDESQLLSLHQLLAAVDPKEAGRWHWRDGRKVRRGLERWWERGGLPSGDDRAQQSSGRHARSAVIREPTDFLDSGLSFFGCTSLSRRFAHG